MKEYLGIYIKTEKKSTGQDWDGALLLAIINSINCLIIGSRCIPNGAHTNHC